MFVPDWSHQINLISGYVNQFVENDDYIEFDTIEREEWMILADLKLQSNNESNKPMDFSADFYEQDRLKYTIQEIGDMPHWINMQKNSNTLRNNPTPNPVDIKKFNNAQMVAYQIVHDRFTCISESKEQLLMIITGQGGSGKSFVIQALSNLLDNKWRLCAYFGIAAFNIEGYTLHFFFTASHKREKMDH